MTVRRQDREHDGRAPARRGGSPRWAPVDVPIDSPVRWSLRIARIGGVEVRLHALLAAWLGLVGVRVLAGPLIGDPGPRSAALIGLEAAAVLLAASLHEIGRLVVAGRLDALPLSINLWPLGALDDLPSHAEWRTRIRSVAGGLGTLLGVGTIVGLVLWLATGTLWGVAIPSPLGTLAAGTLVLADGSQPNWLIVLHEGQRGLLAVMALNLVPIAPLSGGRLVEATLMRARGRAGARRISVQIWLVAACVLLLAALALGAWLGVLAAVVGGVAAASMLVREQSGGGDEVVEPPFTREPRRRRRPRETGATGSEAMPVERGSSADPGDLPLEPAASDEQIEAMLRDVGRHLDLTSTPPHEPRETDEDPDADADTDTLDRTDAATTEDEGSSLDRVLAKIADGGMNSLDDGDRAILERETARRNADG